MNEYYPSKVVQEQEILFEKKRRALLKIKEFGLELPYISSSFSYEHLLANYMVLDISNTETEYLKKGIEALINCLKSVQNKPLYTRKDVEQKIYNMRGGNLDKYISEKKENYKNVEKWVNDMIDTELLNDVASRKVTVEVLNREIAEFKTRLGRVNVILDIKDGTLQFNDKKKMEQLIIYSKEIIENPYPHIFVDADSFVLFRELHSIYKDTESPLADYSFIYRQMAEKDKLINPSFKPEKFREWINSDPFYIEVGTKFKTYDKCFTKEKYNFYQYVKSKQ